MHSILVITVHSIQETIIATITANLQSIHIFILVTYTVVFIALSNISLTFFPFLAGCFLTLSCIFFFSFSCFLHHFCFGLLSFLRFQFIEYSIFGDTNCCTVQCFLPLRGNRNLTPCNSIQYWPTLLESREKSNKPPTGSNWKRHPFWRYKQLWTQLETSEGILCLNYTPESTHDSVTVPILSKSLQHQALVRCHNLLPVGHQGSEKTLECLHTEAYWVGMAQDVEQHCRNCTVCQHSSRSYLHHHMPPSQMYQLANHGKW